MTPVPDRLGMLAGNSHKIRTPSAIDRGAAICRRQLECARNTWKKTRTFR